ncbi:MAG: UDP-2,3-diacylglucosamine diphosphatase [Steroidobacteraceae bacterium]
MTHLFVSDLHLDASAPDAIAAFERFLAHEARGAASLYILGDLFEAWIGDDDAEPQRSRVCEALRRATAAGLPCFVLRGNRDFLFGPGFCERTGARLLPDAVIARLDDTPVLLAHGDQFCTDDHAYQELRAIVRSPAWQRRFLSLPADARTMLADEARAGSRAHTARVVPRIMDVNENAVQAVLRASGARWLIHGHTHRPGAHEYSVDGERAMRLVLGAWYEQGSYLRWSRGEFQSVTLAA